MKIVTAYVRTERAAQLNHELYSCWRGRFKHYIVRGMSGETSDFFYFKHPDSEPVHLPETLKVEVICEEESVDKIVGLIVREAKTGTPGDGIIAIQAVKRVSPEFGICSAPKV